MGAGCSSPLRRLGGKRGKPTQRDSISVGNVDNQDQLTIAARIQAQHEQQLPKQQHSGQKLVLENEITIQSEINEDHPSTTSCYTDGKSHIEDAQQRQATDQDSNETQVVSSKLIGAGAAAAKIMGLSGSYVPHDRHLLVSPALSPAPSICQSPAPVSHHVGSPISLDLNDLNEAFKTLTFGLLDNQLKYTIKRPERNQQSEMHQYYVQQLVQSRSDLINYISVVFFTTDSNQHQAQDSNIVETLSNQIESNLRALCDDNSFNLRFLNLSYDHLRKYIHCNNLQDVAMKVFEEEFRENSQRLIVIILSNNANNQSGGTIDIPNNNINDSPNGQQPTLDCSDVRLPTKIDAQLINKLLDTQDKLDSEGQKLVKKWYNQVGNSYYLSPIYLVDSRILSESREEREQARQSWCNDSNTLISSFIQLIDKDQEAASSIKLTSLFASYIEFINKESSLQKRTLLIRNYSQHNNALTNQPSASSNKLGSLSELARLLADPNKLSLKRLLTDDEFIKTINDWVCENFNKYVECFLENRIVQGKYAPPFIERNLFIELSQQRLILEHYLGNTTENFEIKCHNFYTNQIQPLLSKFTSSSDPNQPSGLARHSETSGSQQSLVSQPSTNHLVLISGPRGCGKTTLFAQLIRYVAQEFYNKAQIIYRFCGLTIDSYNSNRLLRSICEQFCQTQGENITAASYIYSARREVMNSLNKIIKQQNSIILLDGIDTPERSFEASLDWLCEIEANPRIKIFIMLETDSDLYKKVLSSYTDATYITLDNPTLTEWAQMLTSTARSRRFNSASNLYEELKSLNSPTQDPHSSKTTSGELVTYRDVSDALHMCRIRQMNNEHVFPELTTKLIQDNSTLGLKNIHQAVLRHLHYLISPYSLCALLVAINTSRYGLSELDIVNIMNLISSKNHHPNQQTSKEAHQGPTKSFSSSYLNYLKIQLQPWLRYVICDKTIRITVQKDFMRKALDYYTPNIFSNIEAEIKELLLEYYNGPSFKQQQQQQQQSKSSSKFSLGGGSTTTSTSDGSSGEASKNGRMSRAERLWLSTQASEVINLLITINPSKAKEMMMNKQQFYSQFLHRQVPEEFIEDYDRLKTITGRKLSQNEELQHLVNYIRQSIFTLRYDGSQIYSQIYCRAFEHYKTGKFSKSKKFSDILTIASNPPIRNLMPASEISIESFIRTRIGLNQPPVTSTSITSSLGGPATPASQHKPSTQRPQTLGPQQPTGAQSASMQQQQQFKQKIFTIKDNHRHVIVIYPDKSCLAVWDIFEEKPVRTINNVDQPRDLRMIDQKRAVILCNRELRVYDLDSGELLKKLKGVMNQKMPFFEVFGEDYVVALARNRMYVNMLNLNTGELETTFKVGEDRFLNSLLVSADGGICVCGDETQKPFPLLVWNLNERRLMYDLRLDRHEFITRMSAISDDGHFVVSVCKQVGDPNEIGSSTSSTVGALTHKTSPNFIVIYDLNSGTMFKKWKPGLDTCAVAISLSSNRAGKVMNTLMDCTILVWDLATGSKRYVGVVFVVQTTVVSAQITQTNLYTLSYSTK